MERWGRRCLVANRATFPHPHSSHPPLSLDAFQRVSAQLPPQAGALQQRPSRTCCHVPMLTPLTHLCHSYRNKLALFSCAAGGRARDTLLPPPPTPPPPHLSPAGAGAAGGGREEDGGDFATWSRHAHTIYTLHPTPYTLHPTPYTLHPTPYTLMPDVLMPKPSTLNPHPESGPLKAVHLSRHTSSGGLVTPGHLYRKCTAPSGPLSPS